MFLSYSQKLNCVTAKALQNKGYSESNQLRDVCKNNQPSARHFILNNHLG